MIYCSILEKIKSRVSVNQKGEVMIHYLCFKSYTIIIYKGDHYGQI